MRGAGVVEFLGLGRVGWGERGGREGAPGRRWEQEGGGGSPGGSKSRSGRRGKGGTGRGLGFS